MVAGLQEQTSTPDGQDQELAGLYHSLSRVETRIYCVKLLGQRLIARDFCRQVAELQIPIAILNGHIELGIPVTGAVG